MRQWPFRIIDPPSLRSGSAFWTVKRVPFTLIAKILSKWSSVISPSAANSPRTRGSDTRIGEQNIDRSGLILHHCEEPVEVGKIRDVALDAARVVPDLDHRGVELLLATTSHKHSRALCGKALRRSETDTLLAPVITATFPSSRPIAIS